MPRTNVPPITPIGSYPATPLGAGAATFVPQAADVANLNAIPFGSAARMLVLAINTDASAQTVTVTSVADGLNRKGDITTYSVAAAGAGVTSVAVLGPFERNGWLQSDGTLYLQASNANVKFVAVPL